MVLTLQTTFIMFASEMEKCESKYCDCLYHSANAFARLMTKMAEEEFAVTGLAPSHAFLLMTVNYKQGIQPKELSEQLQLMPSTVTRLIEKLETKGLVERKSVGKITEVSSTAAGKKLDKKIRSAWMSLYHRYTNLLGEKEGKQLTELIYNASKKLEA